MQNNQNNQEPKPANPVTNDTFSTVQETANSEPIDKNTPISDNMGRLVVNVFTANQVYPVAGASVEVETNENPRQLIAASTTDRSGRTTTFSLPAPSPAVSQEPTSFLPYAEYRVTIKHPQFFDAVIENVQIFGETLSQLPVNLVPLPELSNGETTNFVIIPNQNL